MAFEQRDLAPNDVPSIGRASLRNGTRTTVLRIGWVLATLVGCAVPVPPSGGPPDTSPPILVSSEPVDGQVDVATDRIRLSFNEYVDQRSIATALSITPAPARPPVVRFGGKEVEFRFDEPLRDSTTFILSIDTGFRDAHGVALDAPIRIAFSTGPEIDRGRLAGRVVEWDRGRAAAGIDVYAYDLPAPHRDLPTDSLAGAPSAPADLSADPAYRTQTDREGRFSFGYLPDRSFFIIAVKDLNRNRRIDAGEWFAPPPVGALRSDTSGVEPDDPWVLSPRDDTPPELRRVVSLSDRRLEARFSEPIFPNGLDGKGIVVSDSADGTVIPVLRTYRSPSDERSLVIVTEPTNLAGLRLRLVDAVADTVSNTIGQAEMTFSADLRPDTSVARLIRIEADSLTGATDGVTVLAPHAAPELLFDASPDSAALASSISVRSDSDRPVPYRLGSTTGVRWRIQFDDVPEVVEIRLAAADGIRIDSVTTRRFRQAPATMIGELGGFIERPDSTFRVVLVPFRSSTEPDRTAVPDLQGRFRFARLPGGFQYRMRLFRDLDGDGRWSPGSLDPYRPAEPIGWNDGPHAVRPRWDTVLPDTLRIGSPPPRVPSENPSTDDPDS